MEGAGFRDPSMDQSNLIHENPPVLKLPFNNLNCKVNDRNDSVEVVKGDDKFVLEDIDNLPIDYLYSELEQYGQVIKLFLNLQGSAFVSFHPLINPKINNSKFGPRATSRRIRNIPSPGAGWTIWGNWDITPSCKVLYSSKKNILSHINEALKDCDEFLKQNLVRSVVKDCIQIVQSTYPKCSVNLYGAHTWWLANLKTEPVFICFGGIPKTFLKQTFYSKPNLFSVADMESETTGNGPQLIHVTHIKTNFKCLLSCVNYSIVNAHELMETYIELDKRVKWLLVAVRKWWQVNYLPWKDSLCPGLYLLEWMVIFFLMSDAACHFLPPLQSLIKHQFKSGQIIVEIKTPQDLEGSWTPYKCPHDGLRLLIGFFHFYSHLVTSKLHNTVLCLYSGMMISREELQKDHFGVYSKKLHMSSTDNMMLLNPVLGQQNMLSEVPKYQVELLIEKFGATLYQMINS